MTRYVHVTGPTPVQFMGTKVDLRIVDGLPSYNPATKIGVAAFSPYGDNPRFMWVGDETLVFGTEPELTEEIPDIRQNVHADLVKTAINDVPVHLTNGVEISMQLWRVRYEDVYDDNGKFIDNVMVEEIVPNDEIPLFDEQPIKLTAVSVR